MTTWEARAVARAIAASRATAFVTVAIAALVLFGWAFDFELLKRVMLGTGVMKPWSAVCFGCAGSALLLFHRTTRDQSLAWRTLPRLLVAVPIAIGSLTLLQYAADIELGFDDLFFHDAVANTQLPHPGRMTPAAATGFLSLGLAILWLLLPGRSVRASQFLAAIAALIGLVGLIGYAYGVESLLRVSAFSSMAFHTGALFAATGLATFFALPTAGFPDAILSRFNGGRMARRVLPFAIVLPFVLGGALLWGATSELYDPSFGLAVFASSNIVVFTTLVWLSALRINRIDRDRELAAKRVADSEARSRAINEHAADLILSLDETSRVRFANPAAREALGIGEGDDAPSLLDRVDPASREALARALKASRDEVGAGPIAFDLTLRGDKGPVRVFEALARNLLGNPLVGGVLVNARDVTERRAAMNSLAESEARWITIFHDTPFPMALFSQADLRYREVNAAYCAFIGRSEADILGRTPEEIGVLSDQRGQELANRVRAGGSLQGEEITLRTGDNRLVQTIVSACAIQQNGVPHVFVILFDVTEARRLEAERRDLAARYEEQHRQAQRLQSLGTLAGGIAHDFNNLLAVISGNLQLLRGGTGVGESKGPAAPTSQSPPDDPVERRSLDEIRKATNRGIELTKRILTFARQPDAASVGRCDPIQLGPAVGEAVGLLRATLPAHINVRTCLDSPAPNVLIDGTSIQQIVLNLGTNAAHAIGDQPGTIEFSIEHVLDSDIPVACAVSKGPPERVGAEPRDEPAAPAQRPHSWVVLSVRDSGAGIAPDVLPRIFEPFFTTKPAGQGTGLGLSMVHGLASNAGGSITVESGPSGGTLFRVYLPAAAGSAISTATAVDQRPSTASQHILYVDDEEALVWLTKRLLERRGYRVTARSDPRQALTEFLNDPGAFDVVVTDGAMPGMSGAQLAGRIHETRPDIPILLISGFLTPEAVDDAKRRGVRHVLLKPSTVEELVASIDRSLETSG